MGVKGNYNPLYASEQKPSWTTFLILRYKKIYDVVLMITLEVICFPHKKSHFNTRENPKNNKSPKQKYFFLHGAIDLFCFWGLHKFYNY